MEIRDLIHDTSALPSRFNIMLEHALHAINSNKERRELTVLACVLSNASWRFWQAWRPPEDNGQEHEWVVFANVLKIAENEKLSLQEKRIATAFCFIHDTFFIKRIMEDEINKLREQGNHEKAKQLERMKKEQRKNHMDGGAENASFLLRRLTLPDDPTQPLLDDKEVHDCIEIVRKHDMWKVQPPEPPSTDNRLAVACLEGDALWPMHPIGVLADLERPKNGVTKDFDDPSEWRQQLEKSRRTLIDFRPKWEEVGITSGYKDDVTIFRTKEGHRLYTEWINFWNL